MPTYKELLMTQGAFLELRTKIDSLLNRFPDTSGGEISMIEIDQDSGDLIITGQYRGDQRTHQITFRDITNGPGLPEIIEPPADMPYMVIAMLQATIQAAWQDYDGNPTDTESFWNFLTMGDQVDVSRGTSPDSPHQKMVDFLAESDRVIAEQGLDVPRETSPHKHAHKNSGSWPTGPDGEYATLKICSCGDQVVEDSTS